MGEPDGLPSMGSHRVGHKWSDAAAAAEVHWQGNSKEQLFPQRFSSSCVTWVLAGSPHGSLILAYITSLQPRLLGHHPPPQSSSQWWCWGAAHYTSIKFPGDADAAGPRTMVPAQEPVKQAPTPLCCLPWGNVCPQILTWFLVSFFSWRSLSLLYASSMFETLIRA